MQSNHDQTIPLIFRQFTNNSLQFIEENFKILLNCFNQLRNIRIERSRYFDRRCRLHVIRQLQVKFQFK